MKTKVAILSLDNVDIHQDSRVLRQIGTLAKCYDLFVITYGDPEKTKALPVRKIWFVGSLSKRKFRRAFQTVLLLGLGRILGSKAYDTWYWNRPGHRQALALLLDNPVDVIHANDWWTLPIAVRAKQAMGARIVLDLHEYSLEEYSTDRFWRFFYDPLVRFIFDQYCLKADSYITVNQMIAARYRREYNINPAIVMNIPDFKAVVSPRETTPTDIRLFHHGAAIRSRQLESMIEVMPLLESRFSLTFMLFGDRGYISDLQNLADRLAPDRVRFISPVPPSKIPEVLSEYDLGFYLLPSKEFNYLASLPNKFFEYMTMAMGVIVGPSPEMANIATRYGFGVASDSFDASVVAAVINRLSAEDVTAMKMNALKASQELNADNEMRKLTQLYSRLLAHPDV